MLKIQLCAFLNRTQLEEAKVCIQSLRSIGKFEGPIFLFTDLDANLDPLNVTVVKAACPSVAHSSAYRTRLFHHAVGIEDSDVWLQLDTDIVVMKELPSFDWINSKVNVQGYPNRNQDHAHFAGFLTRDPLQIQQRAICAGILCFRPNAHIKGFMDRVWQIFSDNVSKGHVNGTWEQPSLCQALTEMNLCEMSLNALVYEERSRQPIRNQVFNHFLGLRGPQRFETMQQLLQKLMTGKPLTIPVKAITSAQNIPNTNFNARAYADRQPDLKRAFGYNPQKLWEHWVRWGIQEKRICT